MKNHNQGYISKRRTNEQKKGIKKQVIKKRIKIKTIFSKNCKVSTTVLNTNEVPLHSKRTHTALKSNGKHITHDQELNTKKTAELFHF